VRLKEEEGLSLGFETNEKVHYKESLAWIEKYLLRQGPLEYFVHHNTLHAFEANHFFDALFAAKDLFRAQTHMPVHWFTQKYSEGRITVDDLNYAIEQNFGKDFRFQKVFKWQGQPEDLSDPKKNKFLHDFLEDFDLLTSQPKEFYQVSTYWESCNSTFVCKKIQKNLDNLKYKFLSAYFDKGTAYWEMEERDKGLSHCFELFLKNLPKGGLTKSLKQSYDILDARQNNITDSLEKFQKILDIPDHHLKNYLFQVLNQSKGWTGLILALNENPNFNPTKITANKEEYFIISLCFDLAGYLFLKDQKRLRPFIYKRKRRNNHQYAIFSFLYDQLLSEGLSHREVHTTLQNYRYQLANLSYTKIIKVWQEAYEANLYHQLIAAHQSALENHDVSPEIQVVTCIDDREESTRRHFEEYSSRIQTFGYAGHFGLNINYKSLRDAHFRALCPVNARPEKYVFEEVVPGEELNFKLLATLKHFLFHNSNLPLVGSFLSLLLGPFTGMLFLFESIAPKKIYQMRKKLKRLMFPPVKTRLNFKKENSRPLDGFTDEELAQAAFNMITITGLEKEFAPIVYLCGHGSKSMNNPHEAAYNCGACAGGKGAPNARLMATALNSKEVRSILKTKDILIPEDTVFIGGYHCTSTGRLLIFDRETIENKKLTLLEGACHYVEKHESRERMRKFENVPLRVTPEEAFIAAQNRSYDFSQPRPEYGHNTNAFCLVGSRKTSKNIFMDRRAFLVSYEEENDHFGDNLLSLLSAVIPVCAGISLEYYFSFVDQENFGAGVKQAHNVTSLMGVMNGYQSDLQMGLPWQMVEIHEPARITFLIESDLTKFERVLEINEEVRNLVHNEWVLIILKTPHGEYLKYRKGKPIAINPHHLKTNDVSIKSEDIYLGKRQILPVSVKGEKNE
jgi:uncharacterized protein YbcC (UPF0753/DUF2309 family)